jgi:hypothetical protein
MCMDNGATGRDQASWLTFPRRVLVLVAILKTGDGSSVNKSAHDRNIDEVKSSHKHQIWFSMI